MPRPRKPRRIRFDPTAVYFKPRGIPLMELKEVTLHPDEMEAIRLSMLEGLDQVVCAKRMNVSQSTFQRTLVSARKKIAEALVHGKALRILQDS